MKRIATIAISMCTVCMSAQNIPLLREDNIDEVIKTMTLDEKVRILVGTGMKGVSVGMPVIGATRSLVPGAAGTTYPIERLGIPAIVFADGPAGLRIDAMRDFYSKTYYCTHFPIGTSLASTWNVSLVEQVGKAIGEEVRDYGVDVLLAPGNNIQRNPLCGRNFEYYSEDPVLSGDMAAAYIRGIQSNGVGTSIKHFAVNSQETKRMGNDARVSQRAIREIYLRGFERTIRQSEPWTVMSSYNKVNGTYTSESRDLLTTVLRNEWGYKGAVVSDWFGGKDRKANVNAGNDMIQPGLPNDPDRIMAAVQEGKITEETLDKNVRRILELIVKTPRFKGYQYSDEPDLKAHTQVTREAAVEGIVLLKNDGALPLAQTVKNVAVYGVTSYDIIPGGSGSGNVNRAYTVSLIEGLRNNDYQSDKAVLERYSEHFAQFKKEHANDKVDWWSAAARPDEILFPADELSTQAARNDVAILTIGRMSGEGNDRPSSDFYLSKPEKQLLTQVADAFHHVGKAVVVLLNIGGAIETASWKDIPNAILLPWQCGQEGGNSMADVFSGRKYPSGKLPMTFPIDLMDHYSSKNMPMDSATIQLGVGKADENQNRPNIDYTNYEEDIYVGYRYFDTFHKDVSFPFGYGLSYTTFENGQPSASADNQIITVSMDVKNTGSAPGKEVAQVYVTAPCGSLEKPAQELKAFAKTRELQPGESETLTMTIPLQDFASFNEKQSAWVVDGGTYTFRIGSSSRDIKATCTAKVKGQKQKVHNVLAPQVKLNILKQK